MKNAAKPQNPEEMLTAQQAAERLGTRYDYLYILLRCCRLKGEQVNGRWRIPTAEVERYRAAHPRIGGSRAANP